MDNRIEQIYYTQEGTQYVLKTSTRYLSYLNTVPGFPINAGLVINAPMSIVNPNDPGLIFIETDKDILPVMMQYTVVDNLGNVEAELSTPYYYMTNDNGTNSYVHLKGLSKSIPNVEAIQVISAVSRRNRYGLKYNQIVLTDKDFVAPDINQQFYYVPSLHEIIIAGVANPLFTMVNGRTYRIMQTILWFEKIK